MVRLIDLAPQLPADDIRASAEFYRDRLGFRIVDYFNDPPQYATLNRDGVEIHLCLRRNGESASAYVWVEGLTELIAACRAGGLTFTGPFDRLYGLREIIVRDPAGNVITFGERI